MAGVREDVSWKELTTLKVGGAARYVIACATPEEIREACDFARTRNLPLVVLGEGSNVLPGDSDYEGVVLLVRNKGIDVEEQERDVLVRAQAGESWDGLVEYAASRGWWGIENLAGIPGTVGAAPVQNIGAYGMDIAQTLQSVEAYDTRTKEVRTLPTADLQLSYRDSLFKHEARYIILRVTFRLSKDGVPHVGYPDLKRAQDAGVPLSSPHDIAKAVREIRSRKFPDLREFGTAGSFFKNPILSQEEFTRLSGQYGALPSFPHDGKVKVPLAYILDHILSLKGYAKEHVFLFGNQPLVLVTQPGAAAKDVEGLASEIEEKVLRATQLSIEREVRNISAIEFKKIF